MSKTIPCMEVSWRNWPLILYALLYNSSHCQFSMIFSSYQLILLLDTRNVQDQIDCDAKMICEKTCSWWSWSINRQVYIRNRYNSVRYIEYLSVYYLYFYISFFFEKRWFLERKNYAGLLIFMVEICKILHARKLCESSSWWR